MFKIIRIVINRKGVHTETYFIKNELLSSNCTLSTLGNRL